MDKLATLYALTQSFHMQLQNHHAQQLFLMISETSLGLSVLGLKTKLGIKNHQAHSACCMVSRADGRFCVLLVVETVEKFRPYLTVIEGLTTALVPYGITLELDVWENYINDKEVAPF